MTPARAFELASDSWRKRVEPVTGAAHMTVNLMADGPAKAHRKALIGEVREMCAEFERVTLELKPLALEYWPEMSEAQLRAWAARVAAELSK